MILVNRWRTPDGVILASRHRNDCQTHTDEHGNFYMVDGGLDYQRVAGKLMDLSIYTWMPHVVKRVEFSWGSYGTLGDQPLTLIAVNNMSNAHIQAVLETQLLAPQVRQLFQDELQYRKLSDFERFQQSRQQLSQPADPRHWVSCDLRVHAWRVAWQEYYGTPKTLLYP